MGIFESLGHVAFKVNDLDASVNFYNTIGFPEMLRLLDAEGKPWIVYHRINENLYLELFPGGDGEPAPANERTGMNHFCLTVANADKAERELAEAGITLMRGDVGLVPAALDISRRTVAKIRQNLFWAFIYNTAGIPLAALGYLNPVVAGAAMALSSVSVMSNALLLKRWRPDAVAGKP